MGEVHTDSVDDRQAFACSRRNHKIRTVRGESQGVRRSSRITALGPTHVDNRFEKLGLNGLIAGLHNARLDYRNQLIALLARAVDIGRGAANGLEAGFEAGEGAAWEGREILRRSKCRDSE